jgi:protein subunit release factor A
MSKQTTYNTNATPPRGTRLFSLSKENGDFVVETFTASVKAGGQNRQHNQTAVRVRHPASGAVGECQEERSQATNRRRAFRRCIESAVFQKWHRYATAMALQGIVDFEREIARRVDAMMTDDQIRVETYDPDAT